MSTATHEATSAASLPPFTLILASPPKRLSMEELQSFFAQYGVLTKKGFRFSEKKKDNRLFIDYATAKDAIKAFESLNGRVFIRFDPLMRIRLSYSVATRMKLVTLGLLNRSEISTKFKLPLRHPPGPAMKKSINKTQAEPTLRIISALPKNIDDDLRPIQKISSKNHAVFELLSRDGLKKEHIKKNSSCLQKVSCAPLTSNPISLFPFFLSPSSQDLPANVPSIKNTRNAETLSKKVFFEKTSKNSITTVPRHNHLKTNIQQADSTLENTQRSDNSSLKEKLEERNKSKTFQRLEQNQAENFFNEKDSSVTASQDGNFSANKTFSKRFVSKLSNSTIDQPAKATQPDQARLTIKSNLMNDDVILKTSNGLSSKKNKGNFSTISSENENKKRLVQKQVRKTNSPFNVQDLLESQSARKNERVLHNLLHVQELTSLDVSSVIIETEQSIAVTSCLLTQITTCPAWSISVPLDSFLPMSFSQVPLPRAIPCLPTIVSPDNLIYSNKTNNNS